MTGEAIVSSEAEALIVQECKLKGYAKKTMDSYVHYIKKFLSANKNTETTYAAPKHKPKEQKYTSD